MRKPTGVEVGVHGLVHGECALVKAGHERLAHPSLPPCQSDSLGHLLEGPKEDGRTLGKGGGQLKGALVPVGEDDAGEADVGDDPFRVQHRPVRIPAQVLHEQGQLIAFGKENLPLAQSLAPSTSCSP